MRFEPAGFTGSKEVPMAKSITDYIFRWLAVKFLPEDSHSEIVADKDMDNTMHSNAMDQTMTAQENQEHEVYVAQADAPSCSDCGSLMTRNGSCYVCRECGSTSGCS